MRADVALGVRRTSNKAFKSKASFEHLGINSPKRQLSDSKLGSVPIQACKSEFLSRDMTPLCFWLQTAVITLSQSAAITEMK